MKFPFRQGIVSADPFFLVASGTPGFVNFNVSPTPTTVVFAHGESNYVSVFDTDVINAWGPLPPAIDSHLYWEIDLLTGEPLYRFTRWMPIVSVQAPISPQVDQFWFDLTTTTMKVWNGNKWLAKVVVFAGVVPGGSIPALVRNGMGSQVGLIGEAEAGFIMTDVMGRPVRTNNFEFLTTGTRVRIKTTAGTSGVLAVPPNAFVPVRASENIPAMSVVYFSGPDTVGLASSNPSLPSPRIPIGIMQTELQANEIGNVTQTGEVTWDMWEPLLSPHVGKPVYVGFNGELTPVRPNTLLAYRVGFVKNPRTVLVKIDAETNPQVYEADAIDIVISAPPPIVVPPPIINIHGERVWSIELPAATSSSDGHMTSAHVLQLDDHEARIETAELDIANRALLVHNHTIADVTGLQSELDNKSDITHNHDTQYAPLVHTHGQYAQVAHNHTIIDVTGLTTALNNKADVVHLHAIADVTNLQASLDGKADLVHTHQISDVDDLALQLAGKSNVGHGHAIADVTNLQVELNTRPTFGNTTAYVPTGNYHPASKLYVDTEIATRAPTVHTHAIADVTGLQSALDGKADLVHTHVPAHITSTPPETGYVLTANGTVASWQPLPPPPSLALDDLTDVDMGMYGPGIGSLLQFNGSNWVPVVLSIPSALNDLSDVFCPSPLNGSVLVYDGGVSQWVASGHFIYNNSTGAFTVNFTRDNNASAVSLYSGNNNLGWGSSSLVLAPTGGGTSSVTLQAGSVPPATASNGGSLTLSAGNTDSNAHSAGNIAIAAGSNTAAAQFGGSIILSTNATERFRISAQGEFFVDGDEGLSGYVLTSNGPGTSPTWQPSGGTPLLALDDLTDVDTTYFSPSTGEFLVYDAAGPNGAGWYNQAVPLGATALSQLSDVDISMMPNIGQVLTWNGTAWAAQTPPAPSLTLDDLTNVTVPSPSSGQVLTFNGTDWVAQTPAPPVLPQAAIYNLNQGSVVLDGATFTTPAFVSGFDVTGVATYVGPSIQLAANGRYTVRYTVQLQRNAVSWPTVFLAGRLGSTSFCSAAGQDPPGPNTQVVTLANRPNEPAGLAFTTPTFNSTVQTHTFEWTVAAFDNVNPGVFTPQIAVEAETGFTAQTVEIYLTVTIIRHGTWT